MFDAGKILSKVYLWESDAVYIQHSFILRNVYYENHIFLSISVDSSDVIEMCLNIYCKFFKDGVYFEL